MTRKLSRKHTSVNTDATGDKKPKAGRVLGFRCSEEEYWRAQRRAVQAKKDVSDLLRSIVIPALKSA